MLWKNEKRNKRCLKVNYLLELQQQSQLQLLNINNNNNNKKRGKHLLKLRAAIKRGYTKATSYVIPTRRKIPS